MTGALLSEVWPDYPSHKSKKTKKRKQRPKKAAPLIDQTIPPLTPDEMETELLEDNGNEELNPNRRLQGMRVSPYTDGEVQYQNTRRRVDLDLNDNIVRPDPTRAIRRRHLEGDSDYDEFLEFKRIKEQRNRPTRDPTKSNEQFNQLLLYVFTGFFLLMIYDNMYKLGKNSY